jgi:hypothetical protein
MDASDQLKSARMGAGFRNARTAAPHSTVTLDLIQGPLTLSARYVGCDVPEQSAPADLSPCSP